MGQFFSKAHASGVTRYVAGKQEYVCISKSVAVYTGWNWKKMFSWGYTETEHKDLVCFNVPEWHYSDGKIKRFSIDLGWTQINSQNWEWVYQKALRLQAQGKIRQGLVLYRFPLGWLKQEERLYKKFGGKKNLFKNYEFKCNGDCKESFLYYRWIVEKARNKFDWNRTFENEFINN